ncbi:unnamed protein product, partial [Laminaria digitata]
MLLAKRWVSTVGKTEEKMKADGIKPSAFFTYIAQFVMAWVLSGVIGHLGADQLTFMDALVAAGFIW